MRLKTIVYEDFTNYRKPSMFIGTVSCGGKCCIEAGLPLSVCQNDGWRESAALHIDDKELCEEYISNPITQAVVFGGLEPFEQYEDIVSFIRKLRLEYWCDDDVVIYTGYTPNEIWSCLDELSQFSNIYVKFGRYIPGHEPHYDEVLGVKLASPNQYAEKISIE